MTNPDPIDDIHIGGEVIRLGQFMKFAGLLDSGGDVKEAIVDGLDRPTSLSFVGDTAYIVTLGGDVLTVADVAPDRHGMYGGCGGMGKG